MANKKFPPYGRQVAVILSGQNPLRHYSGCTSERGTVWIANGSGAWDWHDSHPNHLSIVLPFAEDPFFFRWDFLKGHEPPLILPPVADDPEARRQLAAAILADGVQSVLAGSMRFAQDRGMEIRERMTGPHDAIIEFPEQPTKHDCTVLNLATVTPEPINWLWPGRIPLGMYSLLAGQPGVGKATISYSIAAILTTGGKWPFSEHRAALGSVAILTAEDSAAHTLVPRLMAADADLSRVNLIQSVARPYDDQVIDSPLLLSEDMHQLHGVLTDYPDTRLLIIDPLSAYLGVKDSHRDADVRQVLGPLTDLAARHSVAILGITHLSKNANSSAMARFMGSTGIIAAARAAFLATRHEDELMLLPVKSNVAPIQGGLTYRIAGKTIPGGIQTSCIEWLGLTEIQADDALAQQSARQSAPKKADAMQFLTNLLIDGPVSVDDVGKAADLEGIAWATVRRAYDELGIEAIKEKKFQGKWLWHTPEQAAKLKANETAGGIDEHL